MCDTKCLTVTTHRLRYISALIIVSVILRNVSLLQTITELDLDEKIYSPGETPPVVEQLKGRDVADDSSLPGSSASWPTHEITTHSSPRRIFLGIFTAHQFDDSRRIAIRYTYLREGNPSRPIKICSVSEIQPNCQIVYAFILHTEIAKKKGRRWRTRTDTSTDMLDLLGNGTNKVKAFYEYLYESEMLRLSNATFPGAASTEQSSTSKVQFDFVAHTSTAFVLKPDKLWPPEIFYGNSSVTDHRSLLLFGPTENEAAAYTLLSSNLVKPVIDHGGLDSTEQLGLERILSEIVPTLGHEVRNVTIQDAVLQPPPGDPRSDHVRLIHQWDAYKDAELVTYDDTEEEARVRFIAETDLTRCRYGPRLLIGIMTVFEHQTEKQRRGTIRDTYLSYFRRSEKEIHRICALHELLDRSRADHDVFLQECQLAYTFVAGGNPEGNTERLNYNASDPMILASISSEPDVVLLNIKENMNHGKSQTFFKYATTVVDNHLYFDYIIKCDTDTIIYPDHFLNEEMNRLPIFPHNVRVYGGLDLLSRSDAIYFGGSLYFLSVDLARYIISDACDRKELDVFVEDRAIGLFALSHPLPLKRVNIDLARPGPSTRRRRKKWTPTAAEHPIKNVTVYREAWEKHMSFMAISSW
jgi:hypothetical protein